MQKNWNKYLALQSLVKQVLEESHTIYINGMFEDKERAPKKLFQYTKSLKRDWMGVDNKKVATSGKDKAEVLSKQYSSVFTKEETKTMPSKGPSPFPDMDELVITTAGVTCLTQS